MFICIYYITYVKITFNHSKLRNFYEVPKTFMKFLNCYEVRKKWPKTPINFILHKSNKKMQRKPAKKCFVHSQVWRHLC